MIAAAGPPDLETVERSGGQRFPKAARVRRRREFQELQRSGSRVPGKCFLVVHDRRAGGGSPRVGITVTKKVGIAVVRNRLKRLVREVFRCERPNLEPTTRLVVIARESAPRATTAELRVELTRLLQRFHKSRGEGI